MTRTKILLMTAAALALPLAACRSSDRSDNTGDYNQVRTPAQPDRNYYNDHDPYNRTAHENPSDRGTGESGGATFNRLTGNLDTTVNAGIGRAENAAEQALQNLHYVITDKKLEDNKTVIKAKSAEAGNVEITLERQTDRMTKATVDVGMTGSRNTADLILNKMLENMQ